MVSGSSENRIPQEPPEIPPPNFSGCRPTWSVMIPVYNCSGFLPATLCSVLDQAPDANDMQIMVVDDASNDVDVKTLVNTIAGTRVQYFRHKENVGSLRNFNTCLELARGALVHLLHGDDVVLPGFYSETKRIFDENQSVGACFSRHRFIDEKGNFIGLSPKESTFSGVLDNYLERIASKQLIQYAAIAVRRDVYEQVGGFYGVTYGEDWEMWVRIASQFPVAYCPEVLAEYRIHTDSISGEKLLKAENMRDLVWVMSKIGEYIPDHMREKVQRVSKNYYSEFALDTAEDMYLKHGERIGAIRQACWAIRLCPEAKRLKRVRKLFISMAGLRNSDS